jgi:hypothetical protein
MRARLSELTTVTGRALAVAGPESASARSVQWAARASVQPGRKDRASLRVHAAAPMAEDPAPQHAGPRSDRVRVYYHVPGPGRDGY